MYDVICLLEISLESLHETPMGVQDERESHQHQETKFGTAAPYSYYINLIL